MMPPKIKVVKEKADDARHKLGEKYGHRLVHGERWTHAAIFGFAFMEMHHAYAWGGGVGLVLFTAHYFLTGKDEE